MASYLFTAAQCPAPQTPLTALYASASPPTPVVGTALSSGSGAAAAGLVSIINADQVRGNLVARYGGGFYAVWQGLELSAGSGLTLNVSAGQACADGPAEKKDGGTLALTDGVVCRVWISRAGTLNYVTSASASPLSPPDSATQWVYLGAVSTGGGIILGVDYSGRFKLFGGLPFRRTADADEPDDTPSSALSFWTRTAGGLWMWDPISGAYVPADGASDTLTSELELVTSRLDELERKFYLQLMWTAQVLGPDFTHPDLFTDVMGAG